MTLLYSALYTLALAIFFPLEYFKRPRALRGAWLAEKFGYIPPRKRGPGPVVWIHAVSVGEVLAAIPFIKKMKEAGVATMVLSTITDTGRQMAVEKSPEGVKVIYLPFDLRIALNRAIRSIGPDLFMTMETELWPNLFQSMKSAHVPSFIFNGRISDRSFPRYMKGRFFLRRVFDCIEAVGMQSRQDADRIRELGMPAEKIRVTGNFKFDIRGSLRPPAWTGMLRGTTIVAGSTHEGEEEIILEAYMRMSKEHSPLNLIIAPRHPKRFAEVEALLKARGIRFLKRSDIRMPLCMPREGGSGPNGSISDTVILVDVLGELAGLYSAGKVCIIGGSFIPVGGHNLFEAAYWSKPIVCGPHMNNFPLIEEFVRNNAVRVTKGEGLYDIVSGMLRLENVMEEMGRNARRVFDDNGGAVEKAVDVLRPYIGSASR